MGLRLHPYRPRQNLLVVLVVLLQQLGCAEFVGTFLGTLAAVDAGFDLLHFRLPLLIQPIL